MIRNMKRILRRSKSKGKGVNSESSSVVSAEGTVAVGDYIVKEKDLSKIHKAAWNGDLNKIRNFGNKRQDLNALDKANRTPLHLACYNGHAEVVKYLIGNSAKLNVCDVDQRSPLIRAIQTDHFDIAELLLRRSADPSLIDVNADTALHVAVSTGHSDAVRLLLSYGALVDAPNKYGRTPLHIATTQANSEILELLLENQADPNAQDSSSRTALMLACQADQIGIVKMLLEYKADPNIRDQKGWTADDHAIMGGFHGCSHLIEEQQTMKRATAGSALSGSGLFGSTTNSVDVLGFPLGGPAPADLSGDNEEELSITKKSDDDSWAASNSEVDEPAAKKGLKLSNVQKVPSNESFKSDTSLKGRHQQEYRPQQEEKPLHMELSSRSVSEGFNEEKPTPRERTASKGLISSGTISDWEDDSDILGDLSEKKEARIPPRFGSDRHFKESPKSPSPIQEPNERRGNNPDITPRKTLIPVKGQQENVADHGPAIIEDVFNEDSESDWDSEADDILPSDNSIGNGYSPSQVQNDNVAHGNDAVSPVGSGRGAKDSGRNREVLVMENDSPKSEEEDSADRTENEEEEEAMSYKLSSHDKVNAKDESVLVSKQARAETERKDDSRQSERSVVANGINSKYSLAELETRQKLLHDDQEKMEIERKELEEEKRRQEQMFEERMREVKVEQEEKNEQRLKQMEKLEAEKQRVEHEAREQQERLNEENRRKEEDFQREMERKLTEAKEIEMEQMEEEKRRMRDELMAERHRFDEEKRQLEERRILQEEKETEMQERKENEEAERRRGGNERLEEELKEERKAVAMEKENIEKERKEEMDALGIERQKLEEERIQIEKAKAEVRQIDEEKRRLEEQKRALDEAEKEVDDVKRERQRMEEERNQIEKAWVEVGQMQEEKKKLDEDRRKLEAGKLDAEKMEREQQQMEDEMTKLEGMRKEAEKFERDKEKLEEERRRFADETKKDMERVEMERVRLNDEKEVLAQARQEVEKVEVAKQQLEEVRRQLDEEKRKVEIDQRVKEQFELDWNNLEEEKNNLEAVKRGETDIVQFERQKLEREKEQLMQSRKDDAERMEKERERLEGERRELEDVKRREKEERANEKMKLRDGMRRMEAKWIEDEKNLKNVLQAKIKELTEKNVILEETMRSRPETNRRDTRRDGRHGDHRKDAWDAEPVVRMEAREEQDHRFVNEDCNGILAGEPIMDPQTRKHPAMIEELDDSEADSEVGELIFDEDATGGVREKPKRKTQDWLPQGLFNGTSPGHRRSRKKIISLNVNSNGSHLAHPNEWHHLLDEYDGLDYSSSSMGDADEDASNVIISPVSASTPMIPAGSLAMHSTSQLSQIGGTTHFQNTLQDLRYKIAKEKQSSRLAKSKLRQISDEKEDVLMKVGDMARERQELKDSILQMEKKLQTFMHEMELEQEQRGSAELLLKKTKDQMNKKEHQLSDEQQAREQAELALCKLQIDYQMSQNAVKQLEAERDELHHQLIQRESKRKFQKKLMEAQQIKQEAIYENGSVVLLEAADESRKAAWSQSERMKEELFEMKVEMERLQFQHKGNEGVLTGQIQELESKLADLRQDQIVGEDALHHASQAFHTQLTAVKIENNQLKSTLEQALSKSGELTKQVDHFEKESKDKEKELQDLIDVYQKLESTAKSEIEKKDGILEKKYIELTQMKEEAKSNERMQRSMEDKISRLRQQLGIANASLLERTNQLKIFQQEMDKKLLTQEGHDKIIHMEREAKAKAIACAENMSESLRKAEQETTSLRAAMETIREQTHQMERASEKDKEKLNSIISAVQKEKDQARAMYEEKQTIVAGNLQTLKDSLARFEGDLRAKEGEARLLQQQLNEAEKKLFMSEANMGVLQKASDNQDKETIDSKHEVGQLKEKISNLEMNRHKLESQLEDVRKSLREVERRFAESCEELSQAKRYMELQETDKKKMQELERDKAKLDVIIEQERDRTVGLKKELEHTIQMKNNLEVILAELRNTNIHIGEQLTVESAARNIMSQEVEDHKEMWESEIKSKSKLGIRLSQLQRFKVNQQGEIEEEKWKTVRAMEVKKHLESKLQAEKDRNHQLDQTVLLTKSKLKLAKRRLKELEVPEAKMQTLHTEFERERFNFEAALATQRKQLENANDKLETEMAARQKLVQKNVSVHLELASLQSLQKKKTELMKANKRLGNELNTTKRNMQENYIEKTELELYKNKLDLETKVHLNERLAQVNNYLDEQTSSRDLIDKNQQSLESELRKKLEDSLNNLKSELATVKTSKSDIVIKKETLEAELTRCKTLFKQECEKGQKLEEELEHFQRKVTELESRVRIEQQKALQQRTETPRLEAQKRVPTQPHQQKPKAVDDIAFQVREELNRSISRHMEGASTEFDFQFRGPSNVLGNYTESVASPGSSYLAVLKKNYFV